MSVLQFLTLLGAIIGATAWVLTTAATKTDVKELGNRIEQSIVKMSDDLQKLKTDVAVLKDRSERDQKKSIP